MLKRTASKGKTLCLPFLVYAKKHILIKYLTIYEKIVILLNMINARNDHGPETESKKYAVMQKAGKELSSFLQMGGMFNIGEGGKLLSSFVDAYVDWRIQDCFQYKNGSGSGSFNNESELADLGISKEQRSMILSVIYDEVFKRMMRLEKEKREKTPNAISGAVDETREAMRDTSLDME